MKAEYICADQPVTSFFACDKAADHTFRFTVTSEEGGLAIAEDSRSLVLVLRDCILQLFPR